MVHVYMPLETHCEDNFGFQTWQCRIWISSP